MGYTTGQPVTTKTSMLLKKFNIEPWYTMGILGVFLFNAIHFNFLGAIHVFCRTLAENAVDVKSPNTSIGGFMLQKIDEENERKT